MDGAKREGLEDQLRGHLSVTIHSPTLRHQKGPCRAHGERASYLVKLAPGEIPFHKNPAGSLRIMKNDDFAILRGILSL